MQVTIWQKLNPKTGQYEHNHIENGKIEGEIPLPISLLQEKAWKGALWRKSYGFLIEGKVHKRHP